MKVSLPSNEDERQKMAMDKAMKESRLMQQQISAGSDFIDRPQDEGYRPNEGTARDRAMLEGARDSGKITESGDQGFGGPGSSRVSKPSKPAVVTKEELAKSGYDNLRDYLNAKQGLTRRKEKTSTPKLIDPSNIRSGPRFDDEGLIDPSNIRSGRRPEEEALLKTRAKGMKNGGSVKKMVSGGSASRRADGIAVKGKTRGKIC
jgi:hypothetical protein